VRTILVIGIGTGDPDHVTQQAIGALARASVVFVVDKGEATDDLVRVRRQIADRWARGPVRFVTIEDPKRDRDPADYGVAVADWHSARAAAWGRAIVAELGDDDVGAFLVWGDPSLYDSTIALIEAVLARGNVEFEYEVVPGISSISALVARHRTTMNQIGRAVQLTTGRRLAAGWPEGVDDVFVLLDAHTTFDRFTSLGLEIFWGAYVGTPDEILISGPLTPALAAEISQTRAEARERHGWIMDTYLLRRPAE